MFGQLQGTLFVVHVGHTEHHVLGYAPICRASIDVRHIYHFVGQVADNLYDLVEHLLFSAFSNGDEQPFPVSHILTTLHRRQPP